MPIYGSIPTPRPRFGCRRTRRWTTTERYTDAAWYQVALTHRALHHTLGTFRLDLVRDEPLFTRLRPDPPDDVDNVPALERFARLFGRTALAVEVFAVCEDTRIDAAAQRLLPGLGAALSRRPARGAPRAAGSRAASTPVRGGGSVGTVQPRRRLGDGAGRARRADGDRGGGGRPAPGPTGDRGVVGRGDHPHLRRPGRVAERGSDPRGSTDRCLRSSFRASTRISTIRRSDSSGTSCGSKATRSSTYGSFRCGIETRPDRDTPVSRRPECRCRKRSCA